MGPIEKKKCKNCGKLFIPDHRNAKRQRFCRKHQCRKASKADSQRRWLEKPENQDYFRCPDNTQRVQQWRAVNPGYWRRKVVNQFSALQDPLIAEPTEINRESSELESNALQDLLTAQPAVLIGLIANFTGSALQDDIEITLRGLQQLGLDIVNASTHNKGGRYGIKVSHQYPTRSKGSQTVQLGGSSAGS